jgi:ActR/RegA family two-component response regulator
MRRIAHLSHCQLFIIHADPVMATTLASALEHRGAGITGIWRTANEALAHLSQDQRHIGVLDGALPNAALVTAEMVRRGLPYLRIVSPSDPDQSDPWASAIIRAPIVRDELMAGITALCHAANGH